MNYIAFELDALNKVPLVANAAGIRAQDVTHGLLTLWAYCFREEVDRVRDAHLAGFFGSSTVGAALEAFGFLEADGVGCWRVKGAQRYLRVRESRREGGKKGRAKQMETASQADARAQSGSRAELHPGSKSPAGPRANPGLTPGSSRALKSPPDPGLKRALSPNTDISLPSGERDINTRVELREGGEGQAGPGGAGSLTQAAPVEVQRAPRVPDPYRPPEEGESLESFFARYPWPVSSADVVHQHAMSALTRHCARTKQRVRDVREALTRERHGDLAEIDVGDERQAVAV